ncbi:hypothetical protein BCJMU51_5466 [Bacillus cereus]|uniref:hypothetical protein n=1 Tax=Bacillus cereus TaxID=1396 RepID=UPI001F202DBF|nr:hypothetical protein [Bacillus cereus]BCB40548.1 hypothetical protein BCM0045_5443 [Bacillus cereus]BCC03384.1 hypothetical protein BCM0057_5466 [Bacillus cereus]BCC26903.1 hypothetical protein BCM0079_5496 [Bacillus cereus]BCC38463.1 hypothetical protein BCM0105_5453 [Bacillus cereus]BCC44261.1 hypothetical protein BCJMU01_5428 [Bacillus cereus]
MELLNSNDLEAVRSMYQQAQNKSASLNSDGTYNLYLNFGCGCDEYRMTEEQLNYIQQ